jgi:competence protein ComEC
MSFGLRLSVIGVTGVACGVLSASEWNAAVAVAIAAGSIAVALESNQRVVCLWATWCALAVAHGAHAREYAQLPPPEWILHPESPVLLEGRLARDASPGDAGVRLELADVGITVDGRIVSLRQCDVLAIVGGTLATSAIEQWTAGRRVRMPARLRAPALVRNPGSPTVEWQSLTRPFDLIAAVKSGSLIDVEAGGRWDEMAAAARRYVRGVTHQWVTPLGTQSAAVVTAILIGDRAGLDDEVTRRLQLAGTFHVIAISGGNVAILTTICFVVLRLITRRERLAILLTLLALFMYGAVVGRDASVARAILAASIYLGLRLRGLLPQAINVLVFTALGCAIADPLMVLDVGAWLSFGATLGLVTILPKLIGSADSWVRTMLLATVAAELVIAPIMASVFMRVGLAGLPLNFVAIPAMTIAQISGLALCVVAPWWNDGAAVLARVSHWATAALTGSASLVDVAPWLSWRVPPPPIGVVCAYYLALLTAMLWSGRRVVGRGALWITAACALAMATGPWPLLQRPQRGWLRVTVADVGQGEAVAVQLPNGHALLVDAGGSSGGFDVGGRVVTPALWASGIRRLEWLALTHGDVDHMGGAKRVTEDLRPREIWEGVPVPDHAMVEELRAASRGITWRRLFAGHRIEVAGVSIEVQHPPVPSWERRRVRNDDSVVLRLRFGLIEVLLTGDTGPEFESAFSRDPASPPIRILKVGHHGSRTSSSERFLDAYGPTAALISAGQGNLFGHPAPVVIERLRQRDIDVFRTDRDGAIVIETDGRVARVRTVTGRVLTISPAAMPPPSLPS